MNDIDENVDLALRKLIHKHLSKCDTKQSPRICRAITNEQGYLAVESQILSIVLTDPTTTVQGAILNIEMEMDDE